MKTAAIYARVSSNQQREEKTIESQVVELLKYADERGEKIIPEYIFKDEGYSGSVLVRPGLERLRDLAAEGQIDAILIYSPDRLSRKYAYQFLLLEEFGRAGVDVIFLNSPKATTPEEELVLQFQGMIAEYERAQIIERSRRGKKYRAKCGFVNVLSCAPYGYRYIKKTDHSPSCFEVIEYEADVVKKIYHLFTEESMSIGSITRHLNKLGVTTRKGKNRWNRATVWRMLKNPAYKGTAYYGKTEACPRQGINRPNRRKGGFSARLSITRARKREDWIEIAVPAIISNAIFEHANELLERNVRLSRRNTKTPTLLQGLMVCSECSYSFYKAGAHSTKGKIYYYRCFGSDNSRHENGRICRNKPIRQDYLDNLVWEHVIGLLENPVLIREEIERRYQEVLKCSKTQMRRDTLFKEVTHIKNGMNKLLDAYQEGLIELEELRKRMPELRKREISLNSQMLSLEAKTLAKSDAVELSAKIEDFLKCLRHSAKTLSILERQKIIRLLIKEVVIGLDKITIKHSIPIAGKGSTDSIQKKSYQLRLGRAVPSSQHFFK